MKIIWGQYSGKKLILKKEGFTRPLTQQIKMGIFNTLFNSFEFSGACIADVFCGTGSFGLEAVSIGANVTFVDRNLENLRANLKGISANIKMIRRDAVKALTLLKEASMDLIFMDPPFKYIISAEYYRESFRALKENGILVVRFTGTNLVEPPENSGFMVYKEKIYGDSIVRIYTKECYDESSLPGKF